MHGQGLPSVYVNGPNAYEITFFMITSWHWDCCAVRPAAMSSRPTCLNPIPVSCNIFGTAGFPYLYHGTCLIVLLTCLSLCNTQARVVNLIHAILCDDEGLTLDVSLCNTQARAVNLIPATVCAQPDGWISSLLQSTGSSRTYLSI